MRNTARHRVSSQFSGQTEWCTACGWSLNVLRGHSTARLFHPTRCPRCGTASWEVELGSQVAHRKVPQPGGHLLTNVDVFP